MKKIDSICIIDDDPITVFGIQHKILHAEVTKSLLVHYNGKDALDSFLDAISQNLQLPQIILLDINMPIMDGWQFLDAFIDLHIDQQINIYILTSSISGADREKSTYFQNLTHHQISYLIKPFNQEQLKFIIENINVKPSA